MQNFIIYKFFTKKRFIFGIANPTPATIIYNQIYTKLSACSIGRIIRSIKLISSCLNLDFYKIFRIGKNNCAVKNHYRIKNVLCSK